MPFKSAKQRRFFGMCKHDPQHARGSCPDEGTIDEFFAADKAEGGGGDSVREKLVGQAKKRRGRGRK